MDRREFMKQAGIGIGAAAASMVLPRAVSGATTVRPDVLFIAIEDISPFFGCYGHRICKTPNIDTLAARGVALQRAYCQAPICNPSRASVATGLRPPSTKVFNNSQDWRRRIPEGHKTLPELMRDAGYETIVGGKITHGHKLFKDPWEEGRQREKRQWNSWLKYRGRHQKKGVGTRPKAPCPVKLAEDHYVRRSLCWGDSGMTPDEQVDGAIANAAAARLKQKRGKPVYMALGFHAPHYTLVAPKPFIDMYSPGDIELPRFPEDDLAHCPRRHSVFNTTDQKWLNDDEKREVIAAYYACISYVDYCVGKVMDALRESGREKDTFVVLWGDHGMHLGEHGLWRKATLFEEATRVPLIMAAPWLSSGGTPCTRPTELVDIYPTVADFAGIPALDILEGVSMRPLIEDPKRPWREAAFSWGGGPNHVTLRTERWRYTQHGRDSKNELFDHDADPGEFTNLAEKPEHVETVTELRKLLKAGAAPP